MQKQTSFLGLSHCVVLSNGIVDVTVSTEIGPRILSYGFSGQDNILGLYPAVATPTEWGEWKPWGGHRLWTAPEAIPRSYAPDSAPVRSDNEGEFSLRLRQETDRSGVEKEMEVSLAPEGTAVTITHRITNRTLWPVRLAAWGITIMAPGGWGLMPLAEFRSHDEELLPAQPLVLWYFTDLSDPRWVLGSQCVALRTDPGYPAPQKAGIMNREGWCAYIRGREIFVKEFPFENGQEYPDYGCNNEMYGAGSYLELESLGPMRMLAPGESCDHVERWSLLRHERAMGTVADSAPEVCRMIRGKIGIGR